MYTLDAVLADCVGRYISSQGRVQLNNLINSRTYADCWGALLSWANRQFQSGFSVSIAPLGVVIQPSGQASSGGLSSKTPRAAGSNSAHIKSSPASSSLSFAFLTPFVQRYELQPRPSCGSIYEDELPCTKMNASTLVKLTATGVDVETLRLALSHVFQRIGELIQAREQVVLDFGFGTLVADNRAADFVFKDATSTPAVCVQFFSISKFHAHVESLFGSCEYRDLVRYHMRSSWTLQPQPHSVRTCASGTRCQMPM
jgi:hypothetical protein